MFWFVLLCFDLLCSFGLLLYIYIYIYVCGRRQRGHVVEMKMSIRIVWQWMTAPPIHWPHLLYNDIYLFIYYDNNRLWRFTVVHGYARAHLDVGYVYYIIYWMYICTALYNQNMTFLCCTRWMEGDANDFWFFLLIYVSVY